MQMYRLPVYFPMHRRLTACLMFSLPVKEKARQSPGYEREHRFFRISIVSPNGKGITLRVYGVTYPLTKVRKQQW
jgi:hypothetical protein